MKTVPLGKTGVNISSICLGTMYFGTRISKSLSYKLLDQYSDSGGSFLDTANIYSFWISGFSGGESETLLGQWIKARKNRSRLFIATKMGFAYADIQKGLSSKQIELECEKSLRRLSVDTIDLFYAHGDDRFTPIDETMSAFDRLIKQGKVRYIGASNFLPGRLREAQVICQTNKFIEYCCIQQRYTYVCAKPSSVFEFSQIAANNELIDFCKSSNMTLIAYSVLLNGAYSICGRPFQKQYLGIDNKKRLSILRSVANEIGATANQVVISWMIHSVPTIVPIIGVSTSEQMSENIKSLDFELDQFQMGRLNKPFNN